MSRRVATVFPIFMESRESCLAADGRAWKVDGRAQAEGSVTSEFGVRDLKTN